MNIFRCYNNGTYGILSEEHCRILEQLEFDYSAAFREGVKIFSFGVADRFRADKDDPIFLTAMEAEMEALLQGHVVHEVMFYVPFSNWYHILRPGWGIDFGEEMRQSEFRFITTAHEVAEVFGSCPWEEPSEVTEKKLLLRERAQKVVFFKTPFMQLMGQALIVVFHSFRESGKFFFTPSFLNVDQCCYRYYFFRNRKLFNTTDIELNAIAALAIMGERSTSKNGQRMPAAIGIAIILYPNAQKRFCLIILSVDFDK